MDFLLFNPYINIICIELGKENLFLKQSLELCIQYRISVLALKINLDSFKNFNHYIEILEKISIFSSIVIDFYSFDEYSLDLIIPYKCILKNAKQIRFHFCSQNMERLNDSFAQCVKFINVNYKIKNFGIVYDVDCINIHRITEELFKRMDWGNINYFYNVSPIIIGDNKLSLDEYFHLIKNMSYIIDEKKDIIINCDMPEACSVSNNLNGICPSRLYQIFIDEYGAVRVCDKVDEIICTVEDPDILLEYQNYLKMQICIECQCCDFYKICYGGCLANCKSGRKSKYCMKNYKI